MSEPPQPPAPQPEAEGGRPTAGGAGPGRFGGSVRELAVLLLIALALAFALKIFLVQTFYIPSGSMLQTLQLDDRVLVEKVTYRFRDPQRGETVVFHRPGTVPQPGIEGAARSLLTELGLPGGEMDLIKRVIGLPGERVEIVGGVVLVDGQPLDEPYAHTDGRDFGPVTVPADHLFLLGDNRANSDDSRFGLGMVPASAVVGRTVAVVWPLDHATIRLDHDYGAVAETAVGSQELGALPALPLIARREGGGYPDRSARPAARAPMPGRRRARGGHAQERTPAPDHPCRTTSTPEAAVP